MRITVVQGPFFPVPPLIGGAIEKKWTYLTKQFAKRGHLVTHISRAYPGLPERETIDGVSHIRVPSFDAPKSLAINKCLDLLYSLRVLPKIPPSDIVVSNTFWLPILLRDDSKGKVYVHVARYPRGQMRYYRHVARLQTLTTPIAAAIQREVPTLHQKIKVIPNAVPEVFPEAAAIDAFPARTKSFLYVGRIAPEKGLDHLIDAFRLFSESCDSGWRLIVVGPWESKLGGGGDAYFQGLRRKARAIEDKVEWLGSIFDHDKLNEVYRSAGVFVYPSIAEFGETFGEAPLEAMANGLPPIVSALECFQNFIVDGESGYIYNHRVSDPAATLASKMREVTDSGKCLPINSIACIQKARLYTAEAIADMYLADFAAVSEVV